MYHGTIRKGQPWGIGFHGRALKQQHHQLIVAYAVGFDADILVGIYSQNLKARSFFYCTLHHVLIEGHQIAWDCKADLAWGNNVTKTRLTIPVCPYSEHITIVHEQGVDRVIDLAEQASAICQFSFWFSPFSGFLETGKPWKGNVYYN